MRSRIRRMQCRQLLTPVIHQASQHLVCVLHHSALLLRQHYHYALELDASSLDPAQALEVALVREAVGVEGRDLGSLVRLDQLITDILLPLLV